MICRRLLALTLPETVIKGTDLSDGTICTTRFDVAKNDLGTKRIDPETGRKFYDLNKDPIVSPYTGVSYPRSYFESGPIAVLEEEEEVEQKELDAEEEEEDDDVADIIGVGEDDDEI